MGIQEKNNQELGFSNAKVYEAKSRSPAKERYMGSSFRQTSPQRQRQQSPPRESRESYRPRETRESTYKPARTGNSPLRSSYKATYNN